MSRKFPVAKRFLIDDWRSRIVTGCPGFNVTSSATAFVSKRASARKLIREMTAPSAASMLTAVVGGAAVTGGAAAAPAAEVVGVATAAEAAAAPPVMVA